MKLHVRKKNNFICGRADICAVIEADTADESGYKVVHAKWTEVFEKEAKLIVGEQYDFRKIKGNKDLEQFYKWMVELEVAKAMVYAHKGFAPETMKKVRTDVDELTSKLGMAPSTLGWVFNHPEDKPKSEGKKKKQKTEASSSRAPAKVNLPKRLREIIEALPKQDKAFLEALLDDNGSFKTALEDFKKLQNAEDNPLQTQKIAELEGEVAKFRQELAVKNQRILELETNGCALITLMLSNKLSVLKRYKQTFEYVDNSPAVPRSAAGSSGSRREEDPLDALYPHPLQTELLVPQSRLRWPLMYLPGGAKYGQSPRPDELLPENLSLSTTSDLRRLAF